MCSADAEQTQGKNKFIPHVWVANTCRTSADTLPHQSAQILLLTGDVLCTKANECGNSSEECSTVRQPNRSSLKPGWSYQTADRATSFRPMWASSVQCRNWSSLGGQHLQNKCRHCFSDGSCWNIIIIKQICTFTSIMLFQRRRFCRGLPQPLSVKWQEENETDQYMCIPTFFASRANY